MAGFRKSVRKYVGKAKNAVVGAVKRRYAPKGKINYGRIAGDAAKLVQLMNVEKKYVDVVIASNDTPFSQSEFYVSEVAPALAQGITGSSRNGNSVKLVSARMDFQIRGQSASTNELRYKWMLICRPNCDASISITQVVTQLLDPNIFNAGFYDYHSMRDPEFFQSYKIVSKGEGKLRADGITGQTGINQFSQNLKLNHHLKYDSDASVFSQQNRFYIIALADSGTNLSSTGALISWSARMWYVDN